jgi:hypothetical protein
LYNSFSFHFYSLQNYKLSKVIDYNTCFYQVVPNEILALTPSEVQSNKAKAMNAAATAISKVKERMIDLRKPPTDDEDSESWIDDEDDASWERGRFREPRSEDVYVIELPQNEKEIETFFNSLVENLVFDMAFQLNSNDQNNCWCPW